MCEPESSYADIVKGGHHNDDPCVIAHCNAYQVNHTGQSDVPCVTQVSYADIVKRGYHSDDPCVAGPSHTDCVILGHPFEQHVCASRSQTSLKYGRSRNQQCICNSLIFLAFLHKDENISRADLDLVLDMGKEMYEEVRKRLPNHIHLTTDELPDEVPARRCVHYADMTQLSRYGSFG